MLSSAMEEIERLEVRVEALQRDDTVVLEENIDRLEQENGQMQERIDSLEGELDSMRRDLEQAQDERAEADERAKQEKADRIEWEEKARKLERDLNAAQDTLLMTQEKAKAAVRMGDKGRTDSRARAKELTKLYDENKQLQQEAEQLMANADNYTRAIEDLKQAVNELEDERDDLLVKVDNLEESEAGLQSRIDELEQDKTDLAGDLDDRDSKLRSLSERLAGIEGEHQRALHALEAQLEQSRAEVREVRDEMARAKDETRVAELEDEVAALREQLEDAENNAEAEKDAVAELEQEVFRLSGELAEANRDKEVLIENALQGERRKIGDLKARLKAKEEAIQNEREQAAALVKMKLEVEKELEEANWRNAEYERGHGLEDAVRYQKRLQADILRRDSDIERLSIELSERADACDILSEIAERLAHERAGFAHSIREDVDRLQTELRREFGDDDAVAVEKVASLSEKVKAEEARWSGDIDLAKLYPDMEIREAIQTAVARWKATAEELQRENEELESQRLSLLHERRVQAVQISEKALKFYGLSPTQLAKVTEFAENLRDGKVELPLDNKTLELQSELERLRRQMDEERTAFVRASLEGPVSAARGAAGPTPEELEAKERAEAHAREQMMSLMRDENERLRADMRKLTEELASTVKAEARERRQEAIDRVPSTPAKPAAESAAEKERVDALMEQLEKADGDGKPDSTLLDHMRNEFKRVQGENDELRHQLEELRALASDAQSESQRLGGMVDVLKSQVEDAKEDAERARRELGAERARPSTGQSYPVRPGSAASRASDAYGPGGGGGGGVAAGAVSDGASAFGGGDGGESLTTPERVRDRPPSRRDRSRVQQLRMPDSDPWATEGPMSPSGKRMHEETVTNLPPEEWATDFANTSAVLVECLEELSKREEEVKTLEGTLRNYHAKVASMAAQQTVMYRGYVQDRAKWQESVKELRKRAEDAAAEREALAAKAARLDELTDILGGDPASARDEVKRLTRQVAEYEVNEVVLARKFYLLKAEAEAARKARDIAETSSIEAEAAQARRILYLELWKRGAEERLARLGDLMEKWVPGDDHDRLANELNTLKRRYHDLLSAETSLRVKHTEVRGAPRRVEALTTQVKLLAASLERANAERDAVSTEFKAATAKLKELANAERVARGEPPLEGADPSGKLGESPAELVHALANCRGDAARLEIECAEAKRKESALADRVGELEEALEREAGHAAEADAEVVRLRKELNSVEERAETAERAASGGATPEEAKKLRQDVKDLQSRCEGLAREVEKAREMADIASRQATALDGARRHKDSEVEQLRENVRVLASRSDDDAIIGKLQHQLLAIKSSYQLFARRHDAVRVAMGRLRLANATLEVALDQRSSEVAAAREAGRVRDLALQRAISDIKGETTGGLTLAQTEALSADIQKLAKAGELQAVELDNASKAQRDAEEAAASKDIEIQSLKQQLEDLRLVAQSAPGGGGALPAGSGSAGAHGVAESRAVARRLVELNEQLKSAQLSNLRQRRELAVLRDEAHTGAKRRDENENRMRVLEERVVTLENDLRRKEDEYRQKLAHLARLPPSEVSAAAAAAVGAVAGAGAGPGEPHDPTAAAIAYAEGEALGLRGPTPLQGVDEAVHDEVQQKLREAEETTLKQLKRIAELETSLRKHKRRADAAEDRSRRRKRRIAVLERHLEEENIDVSALRNTSDDEDDRADGGTSSSGDSSPADLTDSDGGASDGDGAAGRAGGRGAGTKAKRKRKKAKSGKRSASGAGSKPDTSGDARTAYLIREQERLQGAAQESVASLNAVLAQKDAVIASYQTRLETMRAEMERERTAERAERRRLVDAAYEDNRHTIEKLRAAVAGIENAPAGLGTGGGVAINEELAERNEELEQRLVAQQRSLAEKQAELVGAQDALSRAQHRAGEALQEAQVLREQLEEVRAEAAVKNQDKLIKTMRAHLAAKEKKLRALRAALQALKDEFVTLQEEHATARATESVVARGKQMAADDASSTASGARGGAGGSRSDPALEAMVEKLTSQVQQFQERLKKGSRALAQVKAREAKALAAQEAMAKDIERLAAEAAENEAAAKTATDALRRARDDLEELRRTSKAQAKRAQAQGNTGAGGDERTRALEKRVKVLEAQNAAYRSAAVEAQDRDAARAATTATESRDGSGSGRRQGRRGGASETKTDAGPPSRAAWEAEKRLQRKIEALTRRLSERSGETEAAKGQAAATQKMLAQVQADNARLQERITALQKRQASTDKAALSALSELEPLQQLRSRIFELEEENAELSRRVDGEMKAKVARLESDCEEARRRAEEAEAAAEEARDRLRSMQRLDSGDDAGAARLRASEERFVKEASLRDQLAEARRQVASLEAAVLSRDATAMELRFELEAKEQEIARVRRRLRELETMQMLGGKARAGGSSRGGKRQGSASRPDRSAELEQVVEAMKRVVEKQKHEIERLRRRPVRPSSGGKEARKADSGRTDRTEPADRAELADLRKKLADAEDAAATVPKLERRVRALEADVKRERAAAVKAKKELATAERELLRISRERSGADASARGSHEGAAGSESLGVASTNRRVRALEARLDKLTQQLRDRDDEVEALRRERDRLRKAGGGAGDDDGEVARLRRENRDLRQELEAFDLDFFEEVEDLKYKYAEAMRKCHAFDRLVERLGDQMPADY